MTQNIDEIIKYIRIQNYTNYHLNIELHFYCFLYIALSI